MGVILAVILWKVAVALMRVATVVMVPLHYYYTQIRKVPNSRGILNVLEVLLLMDLIWSGIPLGVLTGKPFAP